MADALVQSGMLPKHITTPQACVAVIQRGRELGIPPMYALSNIVYIQGKPTANSELMLALIYRDHGDGAVIFSHSDSTQCIVGYKRRNWDKHMIHTFTIEEAKTAGLLSSQTWQKYPSAMLRARAISAVARMAFPDSIGGMYTPEELGVAVEMDREGGIVISGDVVPVAPAGNNVIRPAVEVVDTETGEILDAEPTPLEMQLYEDRQRIISEANDCIAFGHRAKLNLLHREAKNLGLRDVPEVDAAIEAATERIRALTPAQQSVLA
jgi:hypothetical protein